MSTGKINTLLFCATIILAAAPTAIDWGIKEYKESTSTYIGMIMCSDGETTTSTAVYSDQATPSHVVDADGNRIPCGKS